MPTPNAQVTASPYIADPRHLPPLISTEQGKALGIASQREMRRMCQNGTIKAIRIGRHWRIYRDALLEQFGL